VFKNISTHDGLSSNQVICLTGDRFHQVYAGTGRGINRLDQNGNIAVFTQADGLPSNYITRCAAGKDGALWFVSRNTLVRYTPEQKTAVVPGAVYIDRVSVNGNPQRISALGETQINLPDLTYDQNQVQISFFALTFGAGENIKYQYRLDEQEWSQPTIEQTINLNLTSSKHSFLVRAVRADQHVIRGYGVHPTDESDADMHRQQWHRNGGGRERYECNGDVHGAGGEVSLRPECRVEYGQRILGQQGYGRADGGRGLAVCGRPATLVRELGSGHAPVCFESRYADRAAVDL